MLIFLEEPNMFLKKNWSQIMMQFIVSTFALALGKLDRGFIGCGNFFHQPGGFCLEPLLSSLWLIEPDATSKASNRGHNIS